MDSRNTEDLPEEGADTQDDQKPEWVHGKVLSGEKVVSALNVIRSNIERTLEAERAKLKHMISVRDSFRK